MSMSNKQAGNFQVAPKKNKKEVLVTELGRLKVPFSTSIPKQ